MRIKIVQTPTEACIDGVRLDQFCPGFQYEVGNVLGALFLAEGWAVPVADESPALLTPLTEFSADAPPNLVREYVPPYYHAPTALAADRRRQPRRRPL